MRSKFRRRCGAFMVAAVLGSAGAAVLPAGDAEARYCGPRAVSCSSETLYTFVGRPWALNSHYTITSPTQHWVSVFVNGTRYCHWGDTGYNKRWACYGLPAGSASTLITNPMGINPGEIWVTVSQSEY